MQKIPSRCVLVKIATITACLFAMATSHAPGQTISASPSPPATAPASTLPAVASYPSYRYLPDEENWQALCDPAQRTKDPFDPLKCVRLSTSDPGKYLSVGAEVRFRYEHYFNKQWDPRAGSNGYLLQRYLADFDLHEDRVRVFLQLEHSDALWAHPPNDPTWTDEFASTSAYVEYGIGGRSDAVTHPVTIRAGRQLLAYGAQRMVDDRYGLNTLQPFDGVRARVTAGAWRTDVFWVRPVTVAPYGFDNLADKTRSLGGVYATRATPGTTLDAYGFVDQRQLQFAWRGSQPEVRWTLGTRYATTTPPIDSDTELAYQFGSFGGAPIGAFAIESNVGYSWGRDLNRYRLGLGGGYATGDHGSAGTPFSQFQPPYPTGLTFGIVQANGIINTAGFTPNFTYTHRSLSASFKDYFYYRQSLADGLYAPANIPLRAPAGSKAAPIGNLGFVTVTQQLDRHASLSAAYARYLIGPFLEESGPAPHVPSASTAYYSAAFTYRI